MGPLVLTGMSEKKALAVKQIEKTFTQVKRFKVGDPKRDARGVQIKGVTALTVKEVLPLQHAQLLKLCMVVNDDDFDKATMEAGQKTNGHFLHWFKDDGHEER